MAYGRNSKPLQAGITVRTDRRFFSYNVGRTRLLFIYGFTGLKCFILPICFPRKAWLTMVNQNFSSCLPEEETKGRVAIKGDEVCGIVITKCRTVIEAICAVD